MQARFLGPRPSAEGRVMARGRRSTPNFHAHDGEGPVRTAAPRPGELDLFAPSAPDVYAPLSWSDERATASAPIATRATELAEQEKRRRDQLHERLT